MKLFKKPVFAFLLCSAIVCGSTLMSVNLKFGVQCREICNLFFDGMIHDGEQQYGIAKHLKDIYTACDNINIIAESYGITEDDFRYRSEDLRLALIYSEYDASYIYYCYEELLKELRYITNDLLLKDLNMDDMMDLNKELEIIDNAQESISQSGYNQAVREFLRNIPEFPTKMLAEAADVDLPEYFS